MERGEASSGIFVSAVICRTVLLGDTGLPTLFGVTTHVVSTPVMVTGTKDSKPARLLIFTPVEVSLFVSIYSDSAHPGIELSIKFQMPDGQRVEPEDNAGSSKKVDLEAAENGHLFNITMPIDPQMPGLYWVEVYINDVLKTKTPLKVMHGPISVISAASGEFLPIAVESPHPEPET